MLSSLKQFPSHLYGLRDIGGQDRILSAQRTGWVVDSVNLRSQAGTDYTTLARAGVGVIVQLNHGDEDASALPPPDRVPEYAVRCAAYTRNSPGARVWVIGGAMNTTAARASREPLPPAQYADCLRHCRLAIKSLDGHAGDLVVTGAVTPFNADAGDWVEYFAAMLAALADEHGAPRVDGIALATGTHDYHLNQLTSDDYMSAPFQTRHANFRAYRDFLSAVPELFRALPVFITSAQPSNGWGTENIGWIQRAYAEINEWNADPAHQPIQTLALTYWRARSENDPHALQNKPAVIDDLRAALHADYRVRWHEFAPSPKSQVPDPVSTTTPTSPLTHLAEQKSKSIESIESSSLIQPTAPPLRAQFLAHDTPVALTIGQTTTVNLRVKNIGAEAWMLKGAPPIHIAYQWFNADGTLQRDAQDRRTALPHDLAANEEIGLGATLAAPRTPGVYRVQWNVMDGTRELNAAGDLPFGVPVRVTDLPSAVAGWRVESNLNPADAGLALDGEAKTFWDAGKPQAAGQWYRLNLGAPRVVDGLQFLSPSKGFPAAYSLRVSPDGTEWIEISRVVGNSSDVLAVFAPRVMQYAQIDLLDAAPANWMIADILAHPAAEWHAHASHNDTAAMRALDNRVETAWSSGKKQTPGMWFQMDLGSVEKISGVMLIAPPDEFPRGIRVSVWNARANRWQIAAEKTNAGADAEIIFPATPTQFINLQLVQGAEPAWSIQHVRVYREMEEWMSARAS
ncbi:MAG: discoidin domain-containing protein [Chloroflexi bacterium]|nr:discoidin domain-containing protein [Chloroflexota bacterium]